jgi:two-component sensor histidine kinase
MFGADRAILIGLIINELVSNAGKYAYPNCSEGVIWVRVLLRDENTIFLSVRDDGVGLPAGFDPATSKRLGSRLVAALAKQVGAELTRPVSQLGTNFTLLVPLTVDKEH